MDEISMTSPRGWAEDYPPPPLEPGDTSAIWSARNRMSVSLAAGDDVDARNARGRTALLEAVAGGSVDAARYLLDHGADVELADEAGTTPLMEAAKMLGGALVELLLSRGASHGGVSPLDGSGALVYGVRARNAEAVRMLVAAGADVDVADSRGRTPLMHAVEAERGHAAILQLLLDAGAGVDKTDLRGNTALMVAVENNSTAAVRALLAAGADAQLRDPNGNSAVTLASGKRKMQRLLQG